MGEAADAAPQADGLTATSTACISALGSLLEELERDSTSDAPAPIPGQKFDNELPLVRLGIANSLFTALRMKHPATASHSLRVALSTSAWTMACQLPDDQRDAIEVAALLHDVGMVGVPDRILGKAGPLDGDEARILERSRAMSLEILSSACVSKDIMEIVCNVAAWYDGARPGFPLSGQQIPFGARMIAIVEAFDAMTTDHLFRPAISRDMALGELFASAGTHFDPELVREFVELDCCDAPERRKEVASRWLGTVDPAVANSYWQLTAPRIAQVMPDAERLFHVRLLHNMHDAVVFVDADLRTVQWNHGAERLTGIPGTSACGRHWVPGLLGMRNEKGKPIADDDCPVTCGVESGVQSLRRLTISGRNGRTVSVDSHTIPVVADDGAVLGAVLLLHDASPEASLEQRCQTLHEKATQDPLTQVANRAEFDRTLAAFVAQYKQREVPFSLMICDLDRFKQVNDNYGHQAGDEVIKSIATLLKNAARPGDLAARYGGEEFVMICADCDNATATQRAEQVRVALSQMPQAKLEGRTVTASFGVTEVQPGDAPDTMLRRADRGLLMAKGKGRNMVVQLGSGSGAEPSKPKDETRKRRSGSSHLKMEQDLVTPVPIQMAIEKLRGFVADHQANVLEIDGNHVKLETDEEVAMLRRRADRPIAFLIDLQFEEEQIEKSQRPGVAPSRISQTRIHVSVAPRRNRDRRRDDFTDRAREVLASLRSYLMANEVNEPTTRGVLRKAKSFLIPWLSGG